MWDAYALQVDAQAAADRIALNMGIPDAPDSVTRRWAVPALAADGTWVIPVPDDDGALAGVSRGTTVSAPIWPAGKVYS
jgi:hypothetical protein